MSLYSASVKPVSRSSGRSATAAAAYRNAERITDERTGEIHDYRRRSGVDYVASFAPDGMARQTSAELWNKAEASEVRKNARVAREVLVALPHELNQVQRCLLTQSIAQRLADRYGTAGTLAVHLPDREGDQRNHHAHILMTTRRLEASGQLGEKTRELDDVKRGPEEVEWIRGMIEEQTNGELERAGLESRVDRRSLVKQAGAAMDANDLVRAAALCRPPTVHEGPRVTQIRREAARAGRAPLGALDRAAANDQRRQLVRDRAELGRVAGLIEWQVARQRAQARAIRRDTIPVGLSVPFEEPSLAEQLREQEAPVAVESVRKAPAPEPAPQVKPVTRKPSAAQIELATLKASLRPVDEQVAENPNVIKAKEKYAEVEAEVAEARDLAVLIPEAVAKFRAEHPLEAFRHDLGWKLTKSSDLVYCEESLEAVHHTLRYAEGNVRRARESVGHEERAATDRLREVNKPVRARIAELESVVAREQAAEGPSAVPVPSQRHSTPAPRSDRGYRSHVDRDEPERGMD